MTSTEAHVVIVGSLVEAIEAANHLRDVQLEARFILQLQGFLLAWHNELETLMDCRPALRGYRGRMAEEKEG